MKRTPLKRKTRLRPGSARRKSRVGKEGIVRLYGKDMGDLRLRCYVHDGSFCRRCGTATFWKPRFEGDPFAYDMAHIQTKRNHGDTLDNVIILCHACHMECHAKGISLMQYRRPG